LALKPLVLRTVYCIQQLKQNLISIDRICDNDATVTFTRKSMVIQNSLSILGTGQKLGKLWSLDVRLSTNDQRIKYLGFHKQNDQSLALSNHSVPLSTQLLHQRLGHPGQPALERVLKDPSYKNVSINQWTVVASLAFLARPIKQNFQNWVARYHSVTGRGG
jgi:hypothetical protein